jgi:two-component system, NtrC family, sensor kinase
MIFELLLAIFIARYLRKSLQTASLLPKWDKVLAAIMYAAIALLVLEVSVSYARPVTIWLSHLLLLYLIYILYSEKDFRSARPILLAIAPYILLSLFSDITKLTAENQYKAWKNLLGLATVFSAVWMGTMWIITNKQKKALDKERIKTKEEEEQNKIMATLKAQLEVQVAQRTSELTLQKEELQQTVTELKATQTQLIQSEKMASLGELTAGIAHEIQNPLNFVNNFSEVNTELFDELEKELRNGNKEEAIAIANDIKQNLEKITHHGKRADAIVKGMLQHSRKSTGQKEPADINALTDECLRLSYHGLRAKDKMFNATMETNFDTNIGKINIIPQEIGRVLLNLFTNAFYSIAEKKKLQPEGYEPTVFVSTKKISSSSGIGKIQIRIRDNGNGIPQKILDKIYQPFFTTKPTGQGTGLGLSMSYDIITKGHNGTIKAETKEGEFAEFIIELPTN